MSLLKLAFSYFSSFLLVITILASSAFAQTSQNETVSAPNGEQVITVRHLDTGEPVNVKIEKPSKTSLEDFRPSKMTRERITSLMKFAAKQTGQAGTESYHEFPMAAMAFYGGSFLVTIRKLITSPANDPIAISTFLTNQIYDPVSHFSFLAFLIANKTNNKLLDAFGARIGLIRGPQSFENLVMEIQRHYPEVEGMNLNNLKNANRAQLETYARIRAQAENYMPQPGSAKVFEMSRFASGMAAGFIFSGIAADFMKDPMIQHCFLTPLKPIAKISKEIARYGMTTTQACDIAYDTWVSTGKIMNYVPDIVAALISAGVLAKIVPSLKNKLATIAIRGIRIFRVVGAFIPQSRLVLMAEGAYYFLEIHQFILPYIKDPWESWRRSDALEEEYNKFNGLIKGPRYSPRCLAILENKFPFEMVRSTPISSLNAYLELKDSDCGELPLSPITAMNKLNTAHENWRNYWFSIARGSLEKWQQEISSLQSNYEDSKKFQVEVLALIKNNPNATLEDVKPILKKYDLDSYDDSYQNNWHRIMFRNRGEFFLTFMTCGPIERDRVLEKTWGFKMDYRPLSVTNREAENACGQLPANQPGAYMAYWDNGTRGYGGKAYRNLFELLKVAVRKDLLVPENFEKHWEQNVQAPVAERISEKLEEFKALANKLEDSLNRSDVKIMETIKIPFGVIDHLDFQLKQLEGNLKLLGVNSFYEDYTGLRNDFILTLKSSGSTEKLETLIVKFEQGDLLKIALSEVKNPEAKRYIVLQLASRIMSQRLKDSTEAFFKNMTGQNQELAMQIMITASGLIDSMPDTQIYRLALEF